jgi:hypothetical protein
VVQGCFFFRNRDDALDVTPAKAAAAWIIEVKLLDQVFGARDAQTCDFLYVRDGYRATEAYVHPLNPGPSGYC